MMDSKINFHVGIIWLQLPESKFILYFQLEKHLMVFIWDAVVREKCEGWLLMSLIPEANVESQGTWWKHNRRLRMTGIKHFLRLCIWLRLGTWTRKTEKENRLWKKNNNTSYSWNVSPLSVGFLVLLGDHQLLLQKLDRYLQVICTYIDKHNIMTSVSKLVCR